ncbi:MAG TPA: hypothetical protein VD836_16825 [Solirubrobacteraceae bacterium]|nr:hypothetical protein [Solirubrobacteraceae bacterium]
MTDTQQAPRGCAEPPVRGWSAGGPASAAFVLSIVVTAPLPRPSLIRG